MPSFRRGWCFERVPSSWWLSFGRIAVQQGREEVAVVLQRLSQSLGRRLSLIAEAVDLVRLPVGADNLRVINEGISEALLGSGEHRIAVIGHH